MLIFSGPTLKEMPKVLWQLALVYLFQWYALFVYWQFITPMLKSSLYGISEADETKANALIESANKGVSVVSSDLSWAKGIVHQVEVAVGQTGLMNGSYNIVTMLSALARGLLARCNWMMPRWRTCKMAGVIMSLVSVLLRQR